ncbi:MAG: DUF3592 domain-containing protein [Spirochaetes bacterium]|nr:DUF3592 domain-containing protein [Spirochaetota bacterium]
MTRKTIRWIVAELRVLANIEDPTEYGRSKDRLLERTLPVLSQSKQTAPLATVMKNSLTTDLRMPKRGETAITDARNRIDELVRMLHGLTRSVIPVAFLALLCMVGGIIAVVVFGRMLETSRESGHWPWVTGYLLKSRVERHTSSVVGRYGSRMTESTSYDLYVEYRYHVDSKEYRGHTFSFEPRSVDREYWEAKARLYPPNSAVRVYYDSERPGISVLEPGTHDINYIFILLGLVFTGTGVYLAAKPIRFLFL